ncbi:MAG TPA: response regulator [Candidatus Omnitrophota bacterium]|nr:response regulator [Candidatus Omnitrophota bacterium]HPD84342.1 response regulator [Candidatus Omnitrophota bacterium]HRZ03200.1 response regulator [Candidatus Omnitrophota bacterium]
MEFIKVLIADDEKDTLEIMAKKVSEIGYQVVTAHDGQEAWDKIQSELPDVILLDLTMPKMDGLTVLKNLREHPPSKKWQPVIIVSARGELEDMKTGFTLEADHYLTKPCEMEAILKGIRLMVSLIPQRRSKKEMENT